MAFNRLIFVSLFLSPLCLHAQIELTAPRSNPFDGVLTDCALVGFGLIKVILAGESLEDAPPDIWYTEADRPNCNGASALTMAAALGQYDNALKLLDRGANPNHRMKDGRSPLMMAVAGGHLEIVKLLTARRARLHSSDNEGMTALHYLTYYKQNIEVLDHLISLGVDVNAKAGAAFCSCSPMGMLAMAGNPSEFEVLIAERLFEAKAKLMRDSCTDSNYLHQATYKSRHELMRLFVKKIEVDALTGKKWTALHLAVQEGSKESVDILIEAGADVNRRFPFGFRPIQYRLNRAIIDALIQAGAFEGDLLPGQRIVFALDSFRCGWVGQAFTYAAVLSAAVKIYDWVGLIAGFFNQRHPMVRVRHIHVVRPERAGAPAAALLERIRQRQQDLGLR